jgi:hypothetical protein
MEQVGAVFALEVQHATADQESHEAKEPMGRNDCSCESLKERTSPTTKRLHEDNSLGWRPVGALDLVCVRSIFKLLLIG